jgi:hypothetical protein
MRVLDRNGLTEVDITNMTEAEAERSTLGRQMLFELAHSDWSEEQSEIENKLRKQEDEADVASRRDMVLAENARTAESFWVPVERRATVQFLAKGRIGHCHYCR